MGRRSALTTDLRNVVLNNSEFRQRARDVGDSIAL